MHLPGGAAILVRADPSGAAGTQAGDETELLVNVHLADHQDILVGCSKLAAGRFIHETGPDVSPEWPYIQHQSWW